LGINNSNGTFKESISNQGYIVHNQYIPKKIDIVAIPDQDHPMFQASKRDHKMVANLEWAQWIGRGGRWICPSSSKIFQVLIDMDCHLSFPLFI